MASTEQESVPDAARQHVLQISELVTNILVHLPPKNIFGVKRVCKRFARAADESPKIQEKLFLRQRVRNGEATTGKVQYNLADLNPFFFEDSNTWPDELLEESGSGNKI